MFFENSEVGFGCPISKKVRKIEEKTPTSHINAQERGKNPWDSGLTLVARGGSRAKTPPLAARPSSSPSGQYNKATLKTKVNHHRSKASSPAGPPEV